MIKGLSKGWIIGICITFVICVLFIVGIVVLNSINANNNNPPTEEEPPEEEIVLPTLTVPSEINVELLNTTTTYTYEVKDLGNYSVSVYVFDTSIATLHNNVITPKKIGTTKIIARINCFPEIIKETDLNVIDCVKTVEMNITDEDGNVPQRFFTNTNYILEIKQNMLNDVNPEIYYDNIFDLELLETKDTSYFFTFKVKLYGNFTFDYKNTYVNLTKTYFAYALPNNFDVNFNRDVSNNIINLYLFNNNYIQDANNDGYFNNIEYEIVKQQNVYDEINIISYDSNIIEISNNKIVAKTTGTTNLVFKSNISNITKTYTINVCVVKPSSILINGVNTEFNKTDNIFLDKAEGFNFTYGCLPTYAIYDITLNYNNDEIELLNNIIKLKENVLNSVLNIKIDSATVYTLNISLKQSYILNLKLADNEKAVFENSTLTVNLALSSVVKMICTVIDVNNPTTFQSYGEYSLKLDETYINCLDPKITAGNIVLEFLKTGETSLTITNTTFDVSITINIIIL